MKSSKGKKAITNIPNSNQTVIPRNKVEHFLKLALQYLFIEKGYGVYVEKKMNPIVSMDKLISTDREFVNFKYHANHKVYRADLLCVNTKSEIIIIEIKSSLQDFKTDNKFLHYRHYCDKLYLVVTGEWLNDDIISDIPREIGIVHCALDNSGYAVFSYKRKAKKLNMLLTGTRYAMMVSLAWHNSDFSLKTVLKRKPNYFTLYKD